MRQRAMIAMALANKPELLIADEPTTALDVTIQDQILCQLRELEKEYGTSIIFITHDLGVVAELCDRVIVMYGGLIMEEGLIDDIFEAPSHPYTMGLLASIPDLHQDKRQRLAPIPGSPPDMTNPPPGCRLHRAVPTRGESVRISFRSLWNADKNISPGASCSILTRRRMNIIRFAAGERRLRRKWENRCDEDEGCGCDEDGGCYGNGRKSWKICLR